MAHAPYHSEETGTDPSAEMFPPVSERSEPPAKGLEAWPLSPVQERLWLLQESAPAMAARFNQPAILRIRGPMNPAMLDAALNVLLTRHEILRVRFACLEDGPVQIVDEEATLRPYFYDLSSRPESQREAEAKRLIHLETNRGFKLGSDRLFRVAVFKFSPDEHLLLLNLHRIVCDEQSIRMLLTELGQAYTELSLGVQPGFPELPLSFVEFASEHQTSTNDQDAEFWRERLSPDLPTTELPTDRPRPIGYSGSAALTRHLRPQLAAAVKELARTYEVDVFSVLLTAYEILISRYFHQEDITIASPASGRNRSGTQSLLGAFAHMLPLRTNLSGDPSFAELLQRTADVISSSYSHEDLPFDEVSRELFPERVLHTRPFTRLAFEQSNPLPPTQWGELRVEILPDWDPLGEFDFRLSFSEAADGAGLALRAAYAAELFEPVTIERLLEQFETLLSRATENSGARISAFAESLELRTAQAGPVVQEQPGPQQASNGVCEQSDVDFRPVPLSFEQKRAWLLHRLEPEQPVYHQVAAIRLDGPLNVVALQEVVNEIVQRHEILRTVFPENSVGPVQRVCTPTPFQIRRLSLQAGNGTSDGSPREGAAELPKNLLEFIREEKSRPFNLADGPVLRATLLRLHPQSHVLLLAAHEVVADSQSFVLFLQELAMLYPAALRRTLAPGQPAGSAFLPYRAFARFQQKQQQQAAWIEHITFWKEQLAGAPPLLELPTDHPRPATQSYRAGAVSHVLNAEETRQIGAMSQQLGVSKALLVQAAVQVLLQRYSRQSDIVLGILSESRELEQFARTAGNFSNLFPLRAQIEPSLHFAKLVECLHHTTAAISRHRQFPFQGLVEALKPSRDQSFHPLCQVAFSQHTVPQPIETAGLKMQMLAPEADTTKFDLHFHLFESSDGLRLRIEYARDLFEPETVSRMLGHWRSLLEGASTQPECEVARLPILREEERKLLLQEWTATEAEFPKNKTLAHLFDEQAQKTPELEALLCGETRQTYRELRTNALVVAAHLRQLGVGPGNLVAVCQQRTPEMVASILGTLYAGAAYVPMDPAYPSERLAFMVEDAQARVVLTQQSLRDSLPSTNAWVVCIEDLIGTGTHPKPDAASLPDGSQPTSAVAVPSDVAYVIYTSGSTGKPKGVQLEHRNAVAMVSWAQSVFTEEELAGVLASTSICFDLSIFELFVPLCSGGKIILARNALALPMLPAAGEVRMINTVPSAMRELLRVKGVPGSVMVVNLAGEPLPTSLVDKIYAETSTRKVYDLYGPTETTTYSTYALREAGKPATVGRPLANEQVYLLDAALEPVPIGVPGELYIGGAGVTRGYLNRPELTAERFIPDPFRTGGRLYRTGDLARWRSDGNLEFLGRIDFQVKLRGFRIELGEIEAALKKVPGIQEAVVLAREDQPGDQRLVAYVVRSGEAAEGAPTPENLREALRRTLPEFMVPAVFVFLDALPLTPNGKVNRKALPVPEAGRSDSTPFVAPRTPVEEQVAAIWREVLGIEKVGARDNFFDLGGHSLLGIQVISRLREAFGAEIPLFSLFDTPTVESLAAGLASQRWPLSSGQSVPLRSVPRLKPLPVSFVQERLWFLDQLVPESDAYNVPAALHLKGTLNASALERALNEIVRRHEILRTTFNFHNGELTQVVSPSLPISLCQEDISDLPPESRQARACEIANSTARKPFDLARGPLFRATLIRLAEDEHVLAIVLHHTISDGWSLGVLFRELQRLYLGESVPELPIQYADYAVWKRKSMQGLALQRELDYWKQKLSGAPAALELPVDHDESDKPSLQANRCVLEIAEPTRRLVMEAAQRQGDTPFMLLTTALAIVLHRWTGQQDLVVGTVVAGRTRPELEGLLGCFMNFLPLRLRLEPNQKAGETLALTRKTVLEAQAHQECPFEKMVEVINPERRLNQNPLYNVALVMQNFPATVFAPATIQAEPVDVFPEGALLDLRFEAQETARSLALVCEYRSNLFAPETIETLLAAYQSTLEQLLKAPETPVKDFPASVRSAATSASGQHRQTLAITGTFTTEALSEPLRYWLKELGMRTAIEFAPYNQVFQQLLDPASQLARNESGLNVILLRLEDWLRHGQEAPKPNGELSMESVERNVKEFMLAIRGAAARGSTPNLVCFCPPSPAFASDAALSKALAKIEQSLATELESLDSVYTLTQVQLSGWYPVPDYYDPRGEELGHVPYTPLFHTALATAIIRKYHAMNRPPIKVIALDCDNTLWSGVCGEDGPRGIRLDPPFEALQKFMRAQQDAGRLLCLCSKNNEADVRDVFEQRLEMPLRREHFAALRLNWRPKSENLKSVAQELGLGLDSLVFIDDNPVECAEVEANCPEVLALQLPPEPELFPAFLNHCWVFDHLKLTSEDRHRAQMYRQNQQREKLRAQSLSLADFLAGLDLKIHMAPLPGGETGERLTRVAQLTQRTNQFNFTTRRRTESDLQKLSASAEILTVSVTDRFGDYGLSGVMIYETRNSALDVDTFLLSCRVLGRGIEHRMLSRLGEIARERRLNWVDVHYNTSPKNRPALDFLESIGASFRQPLNGGYLFRFPAGFAAEVAFNPPAEPESAPAPEPRNLRQAEVEPARGAGAVEHTASSKFIRCRQIALEAREPAQIQQRLEAKTVVRSVKRTGYVAPRTDLERKLCGLWQQLLHVEPIGINDNFFELGGHSLLAIRLFAELETLTGRKLPLVTLFQNPTIRELARESGQSDSAHAPSLLVPLQPNGSRPPLFLIHGAGGDILWGYANLVGHLPPEQPLYGIRSAGHAGRGESERLEEMASTYVEEIRRVQPHGPYYLGGYCFGGNVACEMARQLEREGESIGLLVLFDASPSNAGYEQMTWWKPLYWPRFARNFYFWLRDFAALPSRDRQRFFGRKLRAWRRKLVRRLHGENTATDVDLEEVIDPAHFPDNELRLWHLHLKALVEHVDKEYPGEVLLLRTSGQPLFCSLEEDFCWGKLAGGGVKVRRIPGSHESIFVEPNVRVLGRELQAALSSHPVEKPEVANQPSPVLTRK